VPQGTAFLLDLPVRLFDLFGLHGRKFLGYHLQRDPLDMPRLRRDPQFRKRLKMGLEKQT
jgi:hypothetical protein